MPGHSLAAWRDPLRGRFSEGGETRRKFDADFREGAVRLVRETGKPMAQVARIWGSTRARWATGLTLDRRRRDGAPASTR